MATEPTNATTEATVNVADQASQTQNTTEIPVAQDSSQLMNTQSSGETEFLLFSSNETRKTLVKHSALIKNYVTENERTEAVKELKNLLNIFIKIKKSSSANQFMSCDSVTTSVVHIIEKMIAGSDGLKKQQTEIACDFIMERYTLFRVICRSIKKASSEEGFLGRQ